jgi:hypothetical protein
MKIYNFIKFQKKKLNYFSKVNFKKLNLKIKLIPAGSFVILNELILCY